MKRVVLNYLVISVISISTALMSCSNDKVRLLDTVTYSTGNYVKYEYDNENRITKTSYYDKEGNLTFSQTFNYIGNDLVKVDGAGLTIEFSKSENKMTMTVTNNGDSNVETSTMDLNNDGFPTKYETINNAVSVVGAFEIHDGNLTKHLYKHTRDSVTLEGSFDYKYDNKKSPLYYCKTPQWWWILSEDRSVHNNVIERSDNSGKKTEYKYEFDSAGYPTKCTAKSSESEYVSEYKYQ